MKKLQVLIWLVVFFLAVSSQAQRNSPSERGGVEITAPVPWVSVIRDDEHSLLVKQSDTDWYEAAVNTPIGEGDMLYQYDGGRSEVYLQRGTYVRMDGNSGLWFTQLDPGQVRMVVTKGTVDARNSARYPMFLDLPGQSVRLESGGRARIRVNADGDSFVACLQSPVSVTGPRGVTSLTPGQALTADVDGGRTHVGTANQPWGPFDDWNRERDGFLSQAAPPRGVDLPESVLVEMSGSGSWYDDPQYGTVWSPNVGSDWAPDRQGRWSFRAGWDWTWISAESWGWYPYHYGRWVQVGPRWAWSPRHVVATVWSPGLVFWIEGPDYVAWYPWPVDVVYGAYLGPAYVNTINVNYVTVINYDDIHRGDCRGYNRPWPGRCDNCSVHTDPVSFREHPVRPDPIDRTPRGGYVDAPRRPSEDRVYVQPKPTPNRPTPKPPVYGGGDHARTPDAINRDLSKRPPPPAPVAKPPAPAPKPNENGPKPPEGGPKPPDHGPKPPETGPKPPEIGPKPPEGGPKPPDRGLKPPESGPKPPEAGPKPPDRGPKPPETGPKPPEAGPKPPDRGPKPPEAGPKPPDRGPKPPESGPKPPEAGPNPPDRGPKPPEAGPKPPDRGPKPPETGPKPPETGPPLNLPDRGQKPPETKPQPPEPGPKPPETRPQPPETRPQPPQPGPKPPEPGPSPRPQPPPQSEPPKPQPQPPPPQPRPEPPRNQPPPPQPEPPKPQPSPPPPQPKPEPPRTQPPPPPPSNPTPPPKSDPSKGKDHPRSNPQPGSTTPPRY